MVFRKQILITRDGILARMENLQLYGFVACEVEAATALNPET